MLVNSRLNVTIPYQLSYLPRQSRTTAQIAAVWQMCVQLKKWCTVHERCRTLHQCICKTLALLKTQTLGSPCPTRRVRRQSRGYATTVAEHPDKYPNRKFHPGNQIGKGAGNMEDQCMHLQSVHAQTNQKQHLQSAVLGSPRRSAWTPHTP